jgi:hypothetical protein
MRGGLPHQVGPDGGKSASIPVFPQAWRHGTGLQLLQDSPAFFSQGNGNYRDVNQNRRNDVLIHPFVGDAVIRTFLNLLQLDGNNPLDVQGARFFIGDAAVLDAFLTRTLQQPDRTLRTLLHTGYTPGEVFAVADAAGTAFLVSKESFLAEAISLSERFESARHGEGYWTDHWTYNTDLLESYLEIGRAHV